MERWTESAPVAIWQDVDDIMDMYVFRVHAVQEGDQCIATAHLLAH